MEFLMTYGWAILVVIAAIAALAYFGVLDPSRMLPEKCEFPAGVDCIDKAAIVAGSPGTVRFAIKNNIGFPIDITNIVASSAGTCGDVAAWDAGSGADTWHRLANNAQATITVTCANFDPGKFSDEFTVTYRNNESGLDHPAVGTIRGRG